MHTHKNIFLFKYRYSIGLLLLSTVFFLCSLSSAFAAGPGGVTSGNTLWLRADVGTSTTVDGGAISSWTDSSTAVDTITQGTALRQPTYVAIESNYNPAVNFNGTQYVTGTNTTPLGGSGTAYTKFAVFNPTNLPSHYNALISSSTSLSSILWLNGTSFPRLWHSGSEFVTGATMGLSVGIPTIVTGEYAGAAGNTVRINGFIGASNTTVQSFNDGPLQIGTYLNNTAFGANGKIAEAITYNRSLGSTELQQVESYLAAKYGITLNQTVPKSYLASDGVTTMWDHLATDATVYNNNIGVIGRDDIGGLNQKQSKTVNTTGGLIVALGNIATDNANNVNTFSTDKSFLSWGDNGESFAWTTTHAPANRNIASRIWKFQENNGDTGTVTISIPDNSSSGSAELYPETNAVYLLTDDDGDFSSGATSTLLSLNGDRWEGTININPSTGPYVTFASEVPTLPVPVMYLDFEGDYVDGSGNGNDGLAVNGTTLLSVGGDRGQVANLDGVNDYITINSLGLPSSFTESAWVFKPTGSSLSNQFIFTQNAGSVPLALWIHTTLRVSDASAGFIHRVIDPVTFPTNQWVHIAVSYDRNINTYTLYKDGLKIGSGSGSAVYPSQNAPTYLGTYSGSGNNFFGYIDNAQMWDSAFNENEIYAVYMGDNGIPPIVAVPNAPGTFTADPGNTVVDLDWTTPVDNGSPIIDYKVEYKLNSSGTWTTFVDGISTNSNVTITGLVNGSLYDFRVSAENAIGFSPVSTTISTTPDYVEYFHIIVTGQSLAVGSTATPIISVSQPNTYSLSSDMRGTASPLVPLTEISGFESPSSGMANAIRGYDPLDRPVIMSLNATGGAMYSDLKKGTNNFIHSMSQVSGAMTAVGVAAGNTGEYAPIGVAVIHGEHDNLAGNAPSYQGYLEEWQRDYEADTSAIVGTPVSMPLFISQMNTGWTGELPVAQYNAHKDNPGKIFLIGPKYQYGYSDNLHLTNVQSKHMGEMFAKVINTVIINNDPWDPLIPTAVVRNANVITLDYNIPVGPLVIDTTNVALRPDYGFEFVQTGGNTVSISSVQLVNNDTQIEITLSAIPTGTDQKIRYAYTCYRGGTGIGMCGGGADTTSVGGNIRDSDTSISPSADSTGLPLYNWGVTFEEDVVDQTALSAALSVSQDGDEAGLQDITFTVTLSGINMGTTKRFDFNITGGTATILNDYTNSHTQISIPNGANSGSITLSVIDDMDIEGTETVLGTISNPPIAVTITNANATAIANILDNDSPIPPTIHNIGGTQRQSILKRIPKILFPRRGQEESSSTGTLPTTVAIPDTTISVKNSYIFSTVLYTGLTHPDVRILQQFLNSQDFVVSETGPGSIGNETNFFGSKTKNALIKFQEAHAVDILQPLGLTAGTGKFGLKTIAFINNMK